MKITVETGSLRPWLDKINGLMPEAAPAIGFVVKDGFLRLAASIEGPAGAIGLVLAYPQVVECDEDGEFYLSEPLSQLVKASRAETLTLSYNKRVSLRGDNGFKASLAVQARAPLPVESAETAARDPIMVGLTVESEALRSLIKISRVMPGMPPNNLRFISVHITESDVWGTVQATEVGEVEYVPLAGDIEQAHTEPLTLNSDYVSRLAMLMGERTRITVPETRPNIIMLSDPDSPDWLVMIAKIIQH